MFPDAVFLQFACQRAPEQLFDLLRERRVLLAGGPPRIEFAQVPELRADIVDCDWAGLARLIADDLVDDAVPDVGNPREFKAEWAANARIGGDAE